jgi:uncharacterized protein (TIGR02147 family)
MKPLIGYTDYRAYLADWLEERKAQGLPASNRWFAQKMGINSTSWLTSVLQGKRGLSKVTANRHTPTESRYFETLVYFNQARSIDERNRYFQELGALRKLKEMRTVTADQYDLYTTWYHSAVRSLLGMHRFADTEKDYERLAAMVTPAITPPQARKSVELLVRLGFARKSDGGVFELTGSAITTGENITSLAVANFQQETMRLAGEAMDRFPRDERYVGTVTVGVSRETFEKIRALLVETSDRIAEMANADERADTVYQVNLQAFPLSKQPRDKGAKA